MPVAEPIEVPREKDTSDKKVTREIEDYLLDIFSESTDEPFSRKELMEKVRSKFSSEYGWDIEAHVAWALDMLHANHLIKRVAPGTWEADEGPDDVYSERETGYAPEGEFAQRGRNFYLQDTSEIKNKTEWNHEFSKSDLSVKMLKNLGKSEKDIEEYLSAGEHPYNRVALKVALKKHFQGIEP